MDAFGFYRKIAYYTCSIILFSSVSIQAYKFSTVLITRNGEIVCSGSLKDTKTVITAASCVKYGDISEYGVLFAKKQKNGTPVEERTVNTEHMQAFNNIAMLHLRNNAWYGGNFVRIHGRLPTRVYDTQLMASGDGICYIVDFNAEQLFKVEIWSNAVCSRKLGKRVAETQICTKLVGPMRRSCPTGAGNPVICKVHSGIWTQVGIHIDTNCTSKPMVATRVSKFRTWLRHAREQKQKATNKEERSETNEADKTPQPCDETEYQCSDGTCIPDRQVCDGVAQCPCGSEDESSCGCDLAGTEFITGFLNNIGPEVSILYITAPNGANVTVTIPAIDYIETREVTLTEKWTFDNTTLIITELFSNKGVHVSSDKPITLIAANSREFSYSTVDGTIVYPQSCLSKSYTVELQQHNFYKTSQFAVIGIQPNTVIQTTSRQGTVKSATLGFLDVYFMQGRDFRALIVQSSENVVVLSGSECGYVPSFMTSSCDHMVNQIPPNTNLGKAYIVSPQRPRTGYMYRVRAAEDATNIEIGNQNGTIIETATIDKITEFTRLVDDSSSFSIVSDKGSMVTQYALDSQFDGIGQGDPSMIVLQSLNQFDSTYNFIVPDHFLRIGLTIHIGTCYDVSGLRLNGEELQSFGMTSIDVIGVGSFYVIYVDLISKWETEEYATLTHIDKNVMFGAMVYGIRVEGAFAWRIGGKI